MALVLLIAYTAFRTARPVVDLGGSAGAVLVLAELAIAVGLVTATGFGTSPLVFALLIPPTLAGFSRGFGFGSRVAFLAIVAVLIPWLIHGEDQHDDLRRSMQGGGEIVLVALVAGYARRISGEADERRMVALDRLGRLSDANVLLFQLHQVTQTLPASLDLTEVLDVTLAQIRELFDADGVAILVHEESDGSWATVRRHGLQAAPSFTATGLPAALGRTVAVRSTDREDDLATSGPGLDPASRSGLYGVLTARHTTIGLLALEHREDHHFTDRDVELLTGFVDPAALAIDNARWFGRLRTLGADEERTRIARDLHDRTGQSLAYVAFELDRITKQAGHGGDVAPLLDVLRDDVRKVIGRAAGHALRPAHRRHRGRRAGQHPGQLPGPGAGAQRPRHPAASGGDRPPAAAAGAGAVAHRPGGRHERRAPRPGDDASTCPGGATVARPPSRWPMTAWALRRPAAGRWASRA